MLQAITNSMINTTDGVSANESLLFEFDISKKTRITLLSTDHKKSIEATKNALQSSSSVPKEVKKTISQKEKSNNEASSKTAERSKSETK